jgi:hypothetical protein
MKHARAVRVATFAAAAAALVAPSVTTAALPKPTQARIVPFKSFGAVGLGTSKAKAFDKWNPADDCVVGTGGRDTCVWFSNSRTDFPVEAAVLELSGGKVCGMLIRAGEPFRGGDISITRLKRWKTEEGVGLGSKLRRARRVLGGKLVDEKRRVTTGFFPATTDGSENLVGEIRIFKRGCEVT